MESDHEVDDVEHNNNNHNMITNKLLNSISILFPCNLMMIIRFMTTLLSLQAEIISTCIISLASPLFTIIDFFFHRSPSSVHKQEHYDNINVATVAARGGRVLLGRIAVGLVAAAYVCLVLVVVMAVAAVLGVGLVRSWAERPLYVRETLQFDYAEAHPTAVFSFGNNLIPVGHTLYVSLLLLMPESDYNRDLGIFQLTAELTSLQGDTIARSNHPCMLQFRSWPIRLTRTFLMGVPLLLGITTETQMITFPILKHREGSYPRTEYIRITLIPRAGTSSLPQFYDAEVIIKSRPPWTKEFVHRWKWTFYVWTTLYIFMMLVMLLVFFLKPIIFPIMATPFAKDEQEPVAELVSPEASMATPRDEREVSESLRRWQRSRSKRKAALLHGVMPDDESVRSSATSISVTQGDTGERFEEGCGDSESVCFRGED